MSPRVPKAEGVLRLFSYDGAWLHASRRPAPTGFFYWRAENRLGVLAGLYGGADWPTVYAATYDPGTGQYGTTLLDVNGDAKVNYWTAAWNGTEWVDKVKLFKSVAPLLSARCRRRPQACFPGLFFFFFFFFFHGTTRTEAAADNHQALVAISTVPATHPRLRLF